VAEGVHVQLRQECSVGEKGPPGKKSEPRSLDSRVKGNRDSEVYRQYHLRDDSELPGRSESERIGGPESAYSRRLSPQP